MSKRIRYLSALAGVFLLSAVFALAQGMAGGQSGMMNGDQNGTMNNNNSNNNWYQQMMQQREQLQSKVQATDRKLSEELEKLQAAKSDDQKIQIMQTMFVNLIDERNYVHDQVLPMMMGNGMMMYGNGTRSGYGMMQNGHTMHSGHSGMQNGQSGMMNGNQNGMMNGNQSGMSNNNTNSANGSSNDWYRQMMRQRQDLQSRVQNTDRSLAGELQKLQAAKTDDQKIDIMETMLSTLIHERTYVHDQALSMMMLNRQTQSARP